jgi:hypothetical protein
MNNISTNWQRCNTQIFWGEIAPCSHVVQIYDNQEELLNLLEGFVAGGITIGDCVIVITQADQLAALEDRLLSHGLDLKTLAARQQYIALDATATLAKFMVNDWPDYHLFMETMTTLFGVAHKNHKNVRAFGDMVAILWSQGNSGATVMLEHLWNTFCEKEDFTLFCAYPQSGFDQDSGSAVRNICSTHTKMVTGWEKSKTEIAYIDVA